MNPTSHCLHLPILKGDPEEMDRRLRPVYSMAICMAADLLARPTQCYCSRKISCSRGLWNSNYFGWTRRSSVVTMGKSLWCRWSWWSSLNKSKRTIFECYNCWQWLIASTQHLSEWKVTFQRLKWLLQVCLRRKVMSLLLLPYALLTPPSWECGPPLKAPIRYTD